MSMAVMLTGAQLAKMTPLRSYAVTTASSLTASVVFGMRLGGGMTPYVNVRLAHCVSLARATSATVHRIWHVKVPVEAAHVIT